MEKLRYIDKIAKQLRLTALVIVVLAIGFAVYKEFSSNQLVRESANRIYVLDNGNSLELALSQDADVNQSAEVKNHLRMFHNFFFNLDPDPEDIEKSIKKALYLGDNSVRQIYFNRKENLFYDKLVDGATSTRVEIDSIQLDLSSEPYRAMIHAKQELIRPFAVVEKNLISTCNIRKVKRTDNNPHGLFIERYQILNTETLNQYSR